MLIYFFKKSSYFDITLEPLLYKFYNITESVNYLGLIIQKNEFF